MYITWLPLLSNMKLLLQKKGLWTGLRLFEKQYKTRKVVKADKKKNIEKAYGSIELFSHVIVCQNLLFC